MKHCVVSYIDPGGIRHSVEVQADSIYEAAALEHFRLSQIHNITLLIANAKANTPVSVNT